MCGMSYNQVGSLIGVSGSTVSRWTREDDWSAIMREASSVEFSEMAARALGVVKGAIDDGDVKTARWYLEKVHPVFQKQTPAMVEAQERQRLPDLSDMSQDELRRLARGEDAVIDVECDGPE